MPPWSEVETPVGDPSPSTNLEIVRGLLAAIADNFIFDRLTLIERIEAGTFDGGDMDEHVFAAGLGLNESVALRRVEPFDSAGRHHRLLGFTNLIATARPWCDRSSDSVVLRKPARGCRNKQCQLELAVRTGVARGFNSVRNDPQHVAKLYHFTVPAGLQSAFGGPVYLTHFGRKSPKFGCGADLSRRSLAVRLSAI